MSTLKTRIITLAAALTLGALSLSAAPAQAGFKGGGFHGKHWGGHHHGFRHHGFGWRHRYGYGYGSPLFVGSYVAADCYFLRRPSGRLIKVCE